MLAARTRRLPRHLVSLLITVAFTGSGPAADPAPVCELPVVSVSLSVGSTDREMKRVVYAPPPGWHVRSHRVVAANRTGAVMYAVGTVPAGWNWSADERSAASGSAVGVAGLSLPHGLTSGGRVAGARDATASDRQAATSSHHALVVEVTAKGGGLWQGGAGVDLTVYAELVYLGR